MRDVIKRFFGGRNDVRDAAAEKIRSRHRGEESLEVAAAHEQAHLESGGSVAEMQEALDRLQGEYRHVESALFRLWKECGTDIIQIDPDARQEQLRMRSPLAVETWQELLAQDGGSIEVVQKALSLVERRDALEREIAVLDRQAHPEDVFSSGVAREEVQYERAELSETDVFMRSVHYFQEMTTYQSRSVDTSPIRRYRSFLESDVGDNESPKSALNNAVRVLESIRTKREQHGLPNERETRARERREMVAARRVIERWRPELQLVHGVLQDGNMVPENFVDPSAAREIRALDDTVSKLQNIVKRGEALIVALQA